MERYGTRCPWCSKTYASAGWLSNHITKVHPEKNLREFTSQKRHLSDVDSSDEMPGESTSQGQDEMLEFNMDIIFESSTREGQDEGSDREVLDFSSDESDSECPRVDEVIQRAGAPIRVYSFPEQDPSYNLYAPFSHSIDYRLASHFIAAKTPKSKIDHFFKNNILKDLNPTHKVQFRSAYTLYKLVDSAANEPGWRAGKVNYPLQQGVEFQYRNIISGVEYLLRQVAYASHMLWGPHREYNNEGDRVYNEMNTATWWEDNQVDTSYTFDV